MTALSKMACVAATIISHACLAAPATTKRSLEAALERSGANRRELELALGKLDGEDTRYLITNASQYDLVNLTADMIIENVYYARKVHIALPYLGVKLDSILWRDWVLPNRVLEEDLSLWRQEFYDKLIPLVKNIPNTAAAAEAIHDWLLVPGPTTPQLEFGQGGERNRKRNPSQLLASGKATCGELCLIYVYLLRSIGIPARHCSLGQEKGHYYCEYWDSQLSEWTAVDASIERKLTWKTARERVAAGEWKALSMYAHPSYPKTRDPFGTSLFDQCINVTKHLTTPLPVTVTTPVDLSSINVSVWKSGVWMTVAGKTSQGSSVSTLMLAPCAPEDRPVLLTAFVRSELYWKLIKPSLKDDNHQLEKAKKGECLRWPSNE